MTLLSSIVFFPLAGALLILALPAKLSRSAFALAFCFTLLTGVLCLAGLGSFNSSLTGFQFVETVPWIPELGVSYHLGADTLSFPLVLLSALLFIIACTASQSVKTKEKEYFSLLLLLETGVMGSFLALDLFLFYVFWEMMLIPMYFLIGIFGGVNKNRAALKFFLYTMAGSLLLLFGILAVYFVSSPHTFNLTELLKNEFKPAFQRAAFLAFFIGFAVKVPVFPFHTWLPDAHVEAPTPVSVLLAGILLKLGAYGFLRFCFPLFPDASLWFQPLMTGLAVTGIVYGGFAALAQTDLKKMIAYSSVSHMGFVLLGFSAYNAAGVRGAVIQMVSHGLVTSGLFLLAGSLYTRAHTREMGAFGGLARNMPRFAGCLIFFAMASLGLPGLSGFPGEFLVLLGNYTSQPWAAAVACIGILLSAAYLLNMIQKTLWGPLPEIWKTLPDLDVREALPLITLALITLAIGLYPPLLMNLTAASLNSLLPAGGSPL